ncbi:acetyltransferase [Leptolyngbya sp. O-77]|uniref:acetyltransferase n=1 Tax=Leptolyngbya sp. O-77 TaxID=1080068 RepID=UPI00257080CC|nr:acetyltransferase [Leptolyngbya sp. O-77]
MKGVSSMFLKEKDSEVLIKIMDLDPLINPLSPVVVGRSQAGEEEQDPEEFLKADLCFPSNEGLPRCWLDAEYQSPQSP